MGNRWADQVVDTLNEDAGTALKALAHRSRWAELREADAVPQPAEPAPSERLLSVAAVLDVLAIQAGEHNRPGLAELLNEQAAEIRSAIG